MGTFTKGTRPRTWRFLSPAISAGALLFAPMALPAASLNVYLSAPGQQSTYISSATTETFNSLTVGNKTSPYNSALGTYEFSASSPMAVRSADSYGGANSSKYLALGAESNSKAPVTLQLKKAASYFGFWWSAGDPNNGLTFYYNSTLLAHVTTQSIVTLLQSNGGTVTAVNGSRYAESSYYGNPNNHQDTSEPFAYVNVFASGTAFNRIVFDNSGSKATGFETDNHSVYLGSAQPNGPSVFVQATPATPVSLVPEPAGLSATGGVVLLGLQWLLRRRRRQA